MNARSVAVLTVVALVAFVTTLDNTIVAAAAPSIARDIGMGLGTLQWVSIAYMLPYAGLLLVAGTMLDRCGRWVQPTGFAVFAVAALLGGFARTPELLIAARAVQGVAAAIIVPATLSLVRTELPQGRRAAGAAVFTAALAAALALGPWLGGVLAEYWHWSWIFFSNLPFVVVAGVLAAPMAARSGSRIMAPVRLGAALTVTAGLVLCTGALVLLGESGGPAAPSAVLGTAGVVLLLVFVAKERASTQPLVPRRLLADRTFTGANVVLLLWGVGVSGIVFFTPLVHQQVLGMSPSSAGLPLVVVAVAVIGATPFVPRVTHRWGAHRAVCFGLGTLAVGLLTLAAVNATPAIAPRIPAFVLLGAGSAFTTPLTSHALDAVGEHDAGTASGVLTSARELSSAIGVACIGLTLTTVRTHQLASGTGQRAALADGYTAGLLVAGVSQVVAAVLALVLLAPRPPGNRLAVAAPAPASGR